MATTRFAELAERYSGQVASCLFPSAVDDLLQYVEQTDWHRVTFYTGLADVVSTYMDKGSRAYIEGRLKYGKYRDKDGIDRYTTEIIASELQMLDSR